MAAPPHPRAAWPSSDDSTAFNLIVIAVGAGVGGYLLWTKYHAEISAGVMAATRHELSLLAHVTDRFRLADAQMARTDPRHVSLRDLYGITHAIGRYVRLPAAGFMTLLGAVCMVRAAPSRFKRAFDLDGMLAEQAASFPTTAAFVRRRLKLVKPIDAAESRLPRPADFALTPAEWAARHATDRRGRFDRAAAARALAAQLGPRWTGAMHAPPAARLMYAALALHLAERRAEATDLLGHVSASLSGAGADEDAGPRTPLPVPPSVLAGVDRLLSSGGADFSKAEAAAEPHAYVATALMGLLVEARLRAGVLAPAQFAWLKLVDRPLWYALHSLGFETDGEGVYLHPNPRVEAIGARDHWQVERLAGAPVAEPALDRALDAVERAAGSPPPAS